MIRMIDGNEDQLTNEQILHISSKLQHGCGTKTLYKVGNVVTKQPTMTTVMTPIP